MKVSVEEVSGCKRALRVEVEPDAVASKLQETVRAFGQRVSVPGFRRGHVPRGLIQRRFQHEIRSEVLRELIPASYLEALKETGLDTVGEPAVEEVSWEEGQPLRYRAVVEVKPTIEVREYRGIPVQREKVEVTDDEVERALQDIREGAAEYVPMEGWPALQEDLVVLDHDGSLDGKPFRGGRAENVTLIVGARNVLPGFDEAVVGMQRGQSKEIAVDFPPDFPRRDLAGRRAEFRITVKEVKKKRVPALDDEFAKSVGDCATVAELREKVRGELRHRKEREQEEAVKAQILDKIAAAHPIDVPEALVDAEAQAILHEVARSLAAQGSRVRGGAEARDALVAKAKEAAGRRVRSRLLLEAIARQEGLDATDEEVEGELKRLAAAANHPVEDLRRALAEGDRRAGLRAQLRERKTLDLLYAQARIGEAYNVLTLP